MAGRLAIGIATAACFLTSGGLYAQGPAPTAGPPAVASNPNAQAASYGGQGGQAGLSGDCSTFGWAVYGTNTAGPEGNYAPGNADSAPGGYPPQAGPHGYMPPSAYPPSYRQAGPLSQPTTYGDCSGMITHSDTREGDPGDETPFEEILCRVARNVTFNIDYINWGIVKPQVQLIGAQPTLATLNPGLASVEQTFPEILPFLIGNELQKSPTVAFLVADGFARAYDTGPISLYENSGIKGTVGLPLTFGTAEVTGFILQHAESQVNLGGLPQGTSPDESFAAIPVKVNEQNSSELLLYSQSFGAEFTSLVFGAEANIVFNPIVPKQYGLLIRPMLGFRFLGIQEEFDVNASNPGVATTTIDSRTINNIYGPQAGVRIELVTQWFTIGADTRGMVGVDQFVASVYSSDPTIGNFGDRIAETRFTAVGAFDLYAKIPIHDQVKLYVAYNLLGTGNISRPQQQIDYNVNESGGVFTNDIHLNPAHTEFVVQGLSAGLEFNF